MHQQSIALRHSLGPVLETLPAKVQEVLKAEFTAVSSSADLKKLNQTFRTSNSQSAPHKLAALRVDKLLGADKTECQRGAMDILKQGDVTLDDAGSVLGALKEWGVDVTDFKSVARDRWPDATAFTQDALS